MISIDPDQLIHCLLYKEMTIDSNATERLCGSELVYVSEKVFLEAAWILGGKQHQFTVREIAITLENLFQEPNFWYVDSQKIWQAISDEQNVEARVVR